MPDDSSRSASYRLGARRGDADGFRGDCDAISLRRECEGTDFRGERAGGVGGVDGLA